MEIERRWVCYCLPSIFTGSETAKHKVEAWAVNFYKNSKGYVRVRHMWGDWFDNYELTIKVGFGLSRQEYSWEMDEEEYKAFINDIKLDFPNLKPIVFDYYCVEVGDHIFELKYINGKYIMEVEFENESDADSFDLSKYMDTVGVIEVTKDSKYNFISLYSDIQDKW